MLLSFSFSNVLYLFVYSTNWPFEFSRSIFLLDSNAILKTSVCCRSMGPIFRCQTFLGNHFGDTNFGEWMWDTKLHFTSKREFFWIDESYKYRMYNDIMVLEIFWCLNSGKTKDSKSMIVILDKSLSVSDLRRVLWKIANVIWWCQG